jgi:hypothetical protein
MTIMTPAEEGRDMGLGICIQFLLQLANTSICRFAGDYGEIGVGEG